MKNVKIIVLITALSACCVMDMFASNKDFDRIRVPLDFDPDQTDCVTYQAEQCDTIVFINGEGCNGVWLLQRTSGEVTGDVLFDGVTDAIGDSVVRVQNDIGFFFVQCLVRPTEGEDDDVGSKGGPSVCLDVSPKLVPTLGEWGIYILILSVLVMAVVKIRSQQEIYSLE